jgi:serine/threonine protein kinase
LRCDVVVKWARHDLPAEWQQALLDEGRVLARLDDPGVVRVHDVGTYEGRLFAVFAHVPGRTLTEHLREGRVPFRHAAALTAALAHTLEQLHRRGVVHRDLKPANVLLEARGQQPGVFAALTSTWPRSRPAANRGGSGRAPTSSAWGPSSMKC